MRKSLALCLSLFVLIWAGVSLAQTFPPLTKRVMDTARMLNNDNIPALEAKLKAYEEKTSRQIFVATVQTLEGYEIADYANRLFRFWKIGDKDKNNGVLLLIAAKERKVRIEVGYGLEGVLTDAAARLIIQNALVPRFKAGDPTGGVTRAIEDILLTLEGEAGDVQKRATRGAQQDEFHFEQLLPLLIFAFIAFMIIMNANRANRRRMSRYDTNSGWVIVPSSNWGSGGGGGFGGGDSGGFGGGEGGSSGGGGASGDF